MPASTSRQRRWADPLWAEDGGEIPDGRRAMAGDWCAVDRYVAVLWRQGFLREVPGLLGYFVLLCWGAPVV